MLDNDQIAAASRILHDHWRAGTKFGELEAVACGRATAPRAMRSRRRSRNTRAASCSAGRSRPPARPARSTSMSRARWPDASSPRPSLPDGGTASMAGNEMRVGEPEFAFRMATRSAAARRSPTACRRCSMRSARCIRRSRFRIRALPISSPPARRRSSPTMPARICSCSGAPTRRTGARSIWSRSGRSSRCAASDTSATARTCSAIPASRWPGSPTNCANSA